MDKPNIMPYTSNQIAWIKKIQGALATLALLNFNVHLYPEDTVVCDGQMYDFVIIGGGNAGAVIAARLVEANYKILLIEAGGTSGLASNLPGLLPYLKYTKLDWNFTTVSDGFTGECNQGTGSLLGKALGGAGTTNFMLYGRGNPRDYEQIAKAADDDSWNWKSMLKYFKKSEKLQDDGILNSKYKEFHSDKGTIGVTKEHRPIVHDYLQGFKQAGESVVIDNIGAGILGYSPALFNIFGGARTHSANSYLPHLKNNPNLHITRYSMATKILFDKNKNAVGVEFVKNGTTYTVKARKEVILSAGPIKSPQLLMLSGIGPREELKRFKINAISNLPVGKDLQNQVGTFLTFKTNRKADPEQFNPHMFPEPLIVGYSALDKSNRYADYESLNYVMNGNYFFLSLCGFIMGFKNPICDKLYLSAHKNQKLVTVLSHVNTKSRGEVLLNSTDPFDQPKIFTGYYTNDEDLNSIADYITHYFKITETPHFKSIGLEFVKPIDKCNRFKFGSKPYWRCYALCMITSGWRYCGTCAIGAVVDNKLKVEGVKKLRVIDASAFPYTVSGAIFGPVVALAEKGAEMILMEHKASCN